MSAIQFIAVKIIFLLGFTVHNIEEGVWLPAWSGYAGRFHPTVEKSQFIFALFAVTITGFLLGTLDIIFGEQLVVFRYLFLGFAAMMGLNAVFPHLASTIALRRYAPGLMTGMLLNLPLSAILLYAGLSGGLLPGYLFLSTVIISAIVIVSLKGLFALGERLLRER